MSRKIVRAIREQMRMPENNMKGSVPFCGSHSFLFDRLHWRDPLSGLPLEPIVLSRTPAGVPIHGAMRVSGTSYGYPIVDSVVRCTPNLAHRYREWLEPVKLQPPEKIEKECELQHEDTVESFGWQWTWNKQMRNERDLQMRVADRFGLTMDYFADKLILDAGAGAGDQSQYMVKHGASVVSVDLSPAVEVVSSKMRLNPNWVGIQCDIMHLPFFDNLFDVVYCEGVIQHTSDSQKTVSELCRVTCCKGRVLATHYVQQPPTNLLGRVRRRLSRGYYNFLRRRFRRMERFKLLWITGNLAAWNYIPVVGWFLRKSGTVMYYDLMPDFKTTWTNTFDYYGQHSFQRFLAPDQFWSLFEKEAGISLLMKGTGVIMAEKS
ncbi:MAG: class I SAM-dependent methyltransferase [Sedimentisphaerales bacterium]|nr:class I SAM-dependent methyltransferase [Sedimentisphaerales bacterium]